MWRLRSGQSWYCERACSVKPPATRSGSRRRAAQRAGTGARRRRAGRARLDRLATQDLVLAPEAAERLRGQAEVVGIHGWRV
jgi:hypothetical protein